MSDQTKERAFEAHVEEVLLRRCGWQPGTKAEWDVERALFPARVCAFLERTQPKLWAEMRALLGTGLEDLLVGTLVKELDVKATLHVLRHGFKFHGRMFRLAWFDGVFVPGLAEKLCLRCVVDDSIVLPGAHEGLGADLPRNDERIAQAR